MSVHRAYCACTRKVWNFSLLQPGGSRLAMECSAVHGKGRSEALSEAMKIYEHEYNYENIEILAVIAV